MKFYALTALTIFLGFGVVGSGGHVLAQDVSGWTPSNIIPENTPVQIERRTLGSGQPHIPGFEAAAPVGNNMYHAPGYMPGYPTAATIWARVIDVPCRMVAGVTQCSGFNWFPELGRGEYIYFRPMVMAEAGSSTSGAGPAPIPAPVMPPRQYRN